MFKFIHTADIHLDSPLHALDYYEGAPAQEFRRATRRALENLVRLAVSEKVAFVLIAGDLYDGDWKDYNTGLYFVSQMTKLRDAGISVYIIAGNHDAASKITKTIRLPDHIFLFPADHPATLHVEGIDVAIHGQSFSSPAIKTDLSPHYPPAVAGCFNIGLLHTSATGREGHEPYAPCSVEGLRSLGYDYWALGHVHQSEIVAEDPPIVFPGNTQGRHARETGSKGCLLVTVDHAGSPRLSFETLDVVRWVTTEVDVTGAATAYDVVDRFNQELETRLKENEGLPLAVRTHLTGETIAHQDLVSDVERWTTELRAAALETSAGRVWLEKIRFSTTLPLSKKPQWGADGPLAELSNLFDELAADADARNKLTNELDDIQKKLPRELKDATHDGAFSADRLADLMEQVRPMLFKRLLKKEQHE